MVVMGNTGIQPQRNHWSDTIKKICKKCENAKSENEKIKCHLFREKMETCINSYKLPLEKKIVLNDETGKIFEKTKKSNVPPSSDISEYTIDNIDKTIPQSLVIDAMKINPDISSMEFSLYNLLMCRTMIAYRDFSVNQDNEYTMNFKKNENILQKIGTEFSKL